MKILLAVVFGCMLLLGVNQTMNASASSPSPYILVPASQLPADDMSAPDAEGVVEDGEAYECRYSPYCQRAAQCTAYCAGGIAVCQNGCCACAS